MSYRLTPTALGLVLLAACSTEPGGGGDAEDTDSAEGSSGASDSGGSVEPLDRDDAPRASAEARCEIAAECTCGAGALQDEACLTESEKRFQMFLDDAEALGLSYDPECGAKLVPGEWTGCETVAEALLQDPNYQDVEAEFPVCGACTRFLFGDAALGEPCGDEDVSFLYDCQQGLSCRRGQCVDPCDQAGVGEECEETFCEPGLRCEFSNTWTCVEPGCAGGESCSPDEFCDLAETLTCVARRPLGEPCRSGECTADAFCDQESNGVMDLCTAKRANGSLCTSLRQCAAGWCDDGRCGTGAPLACVFE